MTALTPAARLRPARRLTRRTLCFIMPTIFGVFVSAEASASLPTSPACQSSPAGSVYPNVCFQRKLTYGKTYIKVNGVWRNTVLHYDWYAPADGVRIPSSRPWVVLIHGGGFITEGSRNQRGDMESLARYFAGQGFVAISPDYFTVPESEVLDPPDQSEDRYGAANVRMRDQGGVDTLAQEAQRNVQALIRYARKYNPQLGIAASNVHAFGVSAGGAVALRLAMRSGDADKRLERSITSPAGLENDQGSQVRGAVGVSAFECGSLAARQPHILPGTVPGTTVTLNYAGCTFAGGDGDAPFVEIHARDDSIVDWTWAKETCSQGNSIAGPRNLCEVYVSGAQPLPGVAVFDTGGHGMLFDDSTRPGGWRYDLGGDGLNVYTTSLSHQDFILSAALSWMSENPHPNAP